MPPPEDSQGRRTSNKLRVQYETANILAGSDSVEDVAPRLLSMLCELLDWDVAVLWEHDELADNLRCVAAHARSGCKEGKFLEVTRARRFARGEGLPGRIWEAGGPVLVEDLAREENFPRRSAVNNLNAGAGFPIRTGNEQLRGIFEFFSQKLRSDDKGGVVEVMEAVGHQMAQFVERYRAESSVRDQGSWLEVTLASIGDAVLSTDVQQKIRFLNIAAEKLTGWSLEEARGRDLDEVLRLVDDERLLSRQGEERLVQVRSTPIRNSQGGTLGAVVVVEDITEQRAAERLARESELSYRRMLDTTYEGVWIADAQARTSYVNQRLCQMLGYQPDELLGLPLKKMLFPEDENAITERLQNRHADREDQSDVRLRHKLGHEVWALTSASPIFDEQGGFQGSFAMLTDVTDRRAQEARLRRSEERTRSLVEASAQAIWVARPDGLLAEDSPSWRGLTGQSFEELRGLGWLDAVHSDDRARVRESWQRAVEQAEVFEEDFRVWSVQNRFVYLSTRGVPVRSESGQVSEWIVANTDVTPRVEAQQELQERARHAAFHAAVKDALATVDDLEVLLARCAEAMESVLGLTTVVILMTDRTTGSLKLTAHAGPLPSEEVAWESSELGRMATTRRSHFANTLRDLEFPDPSFLERENLVAFAGQPIVLGGETLGVAAGFASHVLSVNVLDVLREMTDGLAAWLRRKEIEASQAELFAREQQARTEAETLLKLSTAFARETSRRKLVQSVTDGCTQLIGAAFGSFFYNVVDDKGESYTLFTISGVPREAFESFPMPRNTKVFAPTFHNQGTVVSADITADPRYGHNEPYHGLPPGHLPVRSYLAVSVVSSTGVVHGGLFFGHPEPDRFTRRHVEIAELLAAKAAIAFDRAPLVD